ncbi:MAG: hypothetical protein JSR36_18320 [Proteobacteria bacterium]|nr:hypothetical protein [Pseudomonadota bacterium]
MPRPGRAPAGSWMGAWTVAVLAAGPVAAGEGAFDPAPWIEDLHQVRAVMTQKYANFEWAVFERRMPLEELFKATEARLRAADSDADARQIIDRSLQSIGDAHLRIQWPSPATGVAADAGEPKTLCQALGYDVALRGQGIGTTLPGYHALGDEMAAEFPGGVIRAGPSTVGVVRVGMFGPQGYPELCTSAREALGIAESAVCDAACANHIEAAVYELMGQDLARRIRQLSRSGSSVLLIDITGNGGGSEWAEAAARMVSPLGLRSERREGVRGEHWAGYWETLARELRDAAHAAPAEDAPQLERWAQQVDQARIAASTPCSAEAFWSGRRPPCKWLAPAFYATGILAEADAATLRGKPWGPLVFSPAQYDFESAVWQGPVLVLVNQGTASAAEQFAAVLQDNRAAAIIGTRTLGAGCGHTRGGTPTLLAHSRGVLLLPDCARVRLDDSNEVHGIDPDVPVGLQTTEGVPDAGRWVGEALARGIETAERLCAQAHCRQPAAANMPSLSSAQAP